MKKFRDFLYDYNDLLIAFALLLLAALLIVWRMEAIIDYPKQILADNPAVSEPAIDDEAGNSSHEDDNGTTASEDSGNSENENSHESREENNDETSEVQDSSGLWSNGTLSKKLQVSVSGNSAAAAVQCLIDAGLFQDYQEYQDTCDSLGIDHEKIAAGTFIFEKGFTKSDIADAVNWS